MGKGASKKADAASQSQIDVAKQQVALSQSEQKMGQQIWDQTAPQRDFAGASYMSLARGNVPGIEKYTAPSINAATQQFAMARKQVENMPPGAARDAALRDVSMQQASTNTGIYSGGANDALARTASMGWGGTGLTTGMLGQAGSGLASGANSYGSAAQNYGQMASSKGGMAGAGAGGLGSLAGGIIGK